MVKYHPKNGFTLVELLAGTAILTFVLVAIISFTYFLYVKNKYIWEQAQAINEARKGVDSFVKELREAKDGEDGSYILESADAQELVFFSDIDTDNQIEKVRYFLDGSDLKKGVIKPSGIPIEYPAGSEELFVISKYVRNGALDIFSYFNGNYPEDIVNNPLIMPASLMDVKLVHIFLRINIDPNRAPGNFDLESDIQIRNLKVNL